MRVYIKYCHKGTFELEANLNSTLAVIRHLLSLRLKIPTDEMVLTYKSKHEEIVLEDPYNLEYYGISDCTCLTLKRENEPKARSESIEYRRDVMIPVEKIRSHSQHYILRIDPLEAFFSACKEGKMDIVARMIEENEELLRAFNAEGWNVLHYAAFYGHLEIMELVLQSEVDPDCLTKDLMWTPLMLAAMQGNLQAAEMLLKTANVNIGTENGTALHCACLNGAFRIVELLLLSKASLFIENGRGQLPIDIAGTPEIKQLLTRYMGNSNNFPETYEGDLKVRKLVGGRHYWAVLKTLEGLLAFFDNKQSYAAGSQPIIVIATKEIIDVRRCRGSFFSSSSKHYMRLTLTSGLRYTLSCPQEDVANLWVRFMFAAVLMRKTLSRSKEIVIQSTFDLFPSTADTSYFSFEIEYQLGRGSFGLVYLVRHKESGQLYAMKALNKDSLVRRHQIKYAIREASILRKANHPNIIKLKWSFQTPRSLYMILDYCPNGSLLDLLHQVTNLPEDTTQRYMYQLLLAIEYLHKMDVVYRDLKPENILLDEKWNLKLIDFGLSKDNLRDGQLATSFCGSPAYLSPEMLNKRGVSKSADVYGLGCIMYECLVGYPPFYSETISELFSRIRDETLKFPANISETAKDLLLKLLDREPKSRPSLSEVKEHPFFSGLSISY